MKSNRGSVFLSAVTVGPFKSIEKPSTVKLDPRITVLMGMNEAGKTVFLQAKEKARSDLAPVWLTPEIARGVIHGKDQKAATKSTEICGGIQGGLRPLRKAIEALAGSRWT